MSIMCFKATIINRRRLKCFGKYVIVVVFLVAYVFLLMRESFSAWEESELQRSKNDILAASMDPRESLRRTKSIVKTNPRKNESHVHFRNAHKNKVIRPKRRPVLYAPAFSNIRRPSKEATTTTTVTAETINPIYEYSDEQNAATMKEMAERQRHLWAACVNLDLIGRHTPNAWEFVLSPGHSLSWCNVFKAASSTWLYYFNILGGYDVPYLQRTKSSQLEMTRKQFPRPTLLELEEALPNSVSFLFVREPFERLLSAYRDKLEGLHNKYYKALGEQITKRYRRVNKRRSGPTFLEFVLYLLDNYRQGENFDEHWAPIYTFCTPCSINYTVIAKTETFQRDSEFIIRKAGLETILFNKMPKHNTNHISNRSPSDTKSIVNKYFAQLDTINLDDLLAIYEPDFQLFGYNSSKYYNIVQHPIRNGTIASNAVYIHIKNPDQ